MEGSPAPEPALQTFFESWAAVVQLCRPLSCVRACARTGTHLSPSSHRLRPCPHLCALTHVGLALQDTELACLSAEELRQFLSLLVEEISRYARAEDILVAARDAWLRYRAAHTPDDAAAPALAGGQLPALGAAAGAIAARGRAPPAALAAPLQLQPGERLRLRLEHNCQAQSCSDPTCMLCQHNPTRRCTINLREPPYTYTVDEVIHSPCGATLQAVLVDEAGLEVKDFEGILGYSILITLVDDRKYQELLATMGGAPPAGPQDMGQVTADAFVDEATLIMGDGAHMRTRCKLRSGAARLCGHGRAPIQGGFRAGVDVEHMHSLCRQAHPLHRPIFARAHGAGPRSVPWRAHSALPRFSDRAFGAAIVAVV